ncbi:ROK family transcriptional regulator [Cryptosporangium arvum]|uniref:ROK family transcriptional regulator n=1 Tax=Cryptosporangium arvum TaxID=80871 RepID=UPI0014707B2A|nr:ROK family transcriptional regulator [Cryptosporangium arvum]
MTTWPFGDDAGATAPAVVGVGDLRTANAAAVLASIRTAEDPPRVAELARSTRLSRPTVELIVNDLLTSGLVEEEQAPPARGVQSPGRPARRLRFRPRAGYVVGIDVRSRSLAVGLADLDGETVLIRRRTVRRDLTGAARARAVVEAVRAALAEAGVDAHRVCAATVGTPGWVQDTTRLRYVDNLRDWADVDIAAILGDELRCPVAVDNDANLAALGEQWRGGAATTGEMVFILLGERLGAGIITGGRLLRGQHGAAGEIGFMIFPDGSPLAARAIGEPGVGRPGIEPSSIYSDAAIVRGAADGDPDAIRALELVGERLADALAPVLLALDPAVVVLGTSLFALPDLATACEYVLRAAERRAPALLVDPPGWRLSTLGDDAILIGAVRFGLAAVERVLRTRPTELGLSPVR